MSNVISWIGATQKTHTHVRAVQSAEHTHTRTLTNWLYIALHIIAARQIGSFCMRMHRTYGPVIFSHAMSVFFVFCISCLFNWSAFWHVFSFINKQKGHIHFKVVVCMYIWQCCRSSLMIVWPWKCMRLLLILPIHIMLIYMTSDRKYILEENA